MSLVAHALIVQDCRLSVESRLEEIANCMIETISSPSAYRRGFSAHLWCLIALLLPNYLLPFYFALGMEEGGWLTALTALRWVSFSVLYWIPIGWLVFGRNNSRAKVWLQAFVASVPLYFLCLWLVYPLAFARFHPSSIRAWCIYLAGTVPLFLLVAGLAWFTTLHRWAQRAVLALAIVFFVGGTSWTGSLLFGTALYTWPTSSDSWNLTGGNLVQLPSGEILTGKDIHIQRGKVAGIVDQSTDRSQLPKIDLRGRYVLPGFIDVHTHLDAPVRSAFAPFDFGYFLEEEFSHYADHRRSYLQSGVTAIRDCGGPAVQVFRWRAEINEHRLLGPQLFAVGRLVTAPKGHPVATIWKSFPFLARDGAILARNQQELFAGLDNNMREGPPDAIKFIDGTIGQAREIIDPKLLADGIAWAHNRHLITVVHIETPAEIQDAVNDGATGVEHAATAGALPANLIAQMARTHTFADPTFGEYAAALLLQGIPADQRAIRMRSSYTAVHQLAEAGVPLAVGTDAPLVPYGSGFLDELDQFSLAGFSAVDILTFATRNNAAYLGEDGVLGCIEVGCIADLVVVGENPLTSLETLRKPILVFRNGVQVVERSPATK
jgi:imidazolonepropionase-like amidohydrolase